MAANTPSSSSASSYGSFGSFDELSVKAPAAAAVGATIKFVCSYGGKIMPRHPDGKLRYVGGDTRVLAVDRSIPFSKLRGKLRELAGVEAAAAVQLRCQLPTEDLDALVSVTNDEDLANLIGEYDIFASAAGRDVVKIRSFIVAPSSTSKPSSPPTTPPPPAARHLHHCRHLHSIQAARAPAPAAALRFVHPPATPAISYHPGNYLHNPHHRGQCLVHHGDHRQ